MMMCRALLEYAEGDCKNGRVPWFERLAGTQRAHLAHQAVSAHTYTHASPRCQSIKFLLDCNEHLT